MNQKDHDHHRRDQVALELLKRAFDNQSDDAQQDRDDDS